LPAGTVNERAIRIGPAGRAGFDALIVAVAAAVEEFAEPVVAAVAPGAAPVDGGPAVTGMKLTSSYGYSTRFLSLSLSLSLSFLSSFFCSRRPAEMLTIPVNANATTRRRCNITPILPG